MAKLTVFSSAGEALPYRDFRSDFRVSGISVVRYVVHEVDPDEVAASVSNGAIRPVSGPTTYESKTRRGSPISYFRSLDLASNCADGILSHRLRRARTVGQNIVWVNGSPAVLCAVPMKFQVVNLRTVTERKIESTPQFIMQEPLGITELVDLLTDVSSEAFSQNLVDASVESLGEVAIVPHSSESVETAIGMDIWSLSGSRGRLDSQEFDGATESARYSWAIAALLNYSSDHMVNHFFDSLSHEEVFSRVRQGFGFMQDHAIFLVPSCSLEITHFGDWVPQRSWDRLRDYGFDSSTLFLLGIALARNYSYRVVREEAALRLAGLVGESDSSTEQTAYVEALDRANLLDTLRSLHQELRETRSQVIDTEYRSLFGDDVFEDGARQGVSGVRDLALDKRRRREDARDHQAVTRLTLAATLLAVAAIPGAVDTLWVWSISNRGRLAVGVLAMVLAALVVALALPSAGSHHD